MSKEIDYNIFRHSTNEGLNNFEMPSGKNYLILLSCPIGANVTVKLHNNQGDGIPLKENYYIKASDVRFIYISCDAVEGEIVIGQSNNIDGFEIGTAPTINSIEAIGNITNVSKISSFDDVLLTALDKIINPYEDAIITSYKMTGSSFTDIVNKNLSSDKLIITLAFPQVGIGAHHLLHFFLDGEIVGTAYSHYGGGTITVPFGQISLEGVKGKTLKISGYTQAGYDIGVSVQEYTKKA